MKYFVSNGGKIYGPIDEAKVRRKIAEGFFSRDCLVSLDRREWIKPVSERAAAAKGKKPNLRAAASSSAGGDRPEFSEQLPEFIEPPLLQEGDLPPQAFEDEEAPRKKYWGTIWWIVVILVLLFVAGVLAALLVDVFLLDRRLLSWLASMISKIF